MELTREWSFGEQNRSTLPESDYLTLIQSAANSLHEAGVQLAESSKESQVKE